MEITVKLFAILRVGRFIEQRRAYPPGITVGKVMEDLAVTAQDAPLVFVNGRHADRDHVLQDRDTVAFFPPIGGG